MGHGPCRTGRSENSRFQAFTDELFQSEVSNNTLTLHYTLANPSKKGIKKPEATLGTVLSDSDKTTNICQKYEKKLQSFAYSKLSKENQLTCDLLLLYFHTRVSLGKNSILDEPLGPSLGVQAQLPVLLAEYSFYKKEDISDYLKLLSTIKPYFQSILKLENQKSQAGLFMSNTTLDRILKQCFFRLLLGCPVEVLAGQRTAHGGGVGIVEHLHMKWSFWQD